MSFCEAYHLANSIDDALQALAEAPGPARIVAGGTDLLLDVQQGRHEPIHTLVDVTEIPDLILLERREGALFVGAAVPLNKIVTSELVQEQAMALVEACVLIGGPQVRNTATLGGNVAHALPAGDGTIALVALDAQAEVAGAGGRRKVPMEALFAGPGKSTLDARQEMLVGFYLPLRQAGEGSAFRRVMRPQGVAIAILNNGVWLKRENGRIADIKIALGPSGPVPRRMQAAEDALRGQSPTDDFIAQAYQAMLGEASLRTSRHRSTSEYRQEIAGDLLHDTLITAWERAA